MTDRKENNSSKESIWFFAIFLIAFLVIMWLVMNGQMRIGAKDGEPATSITQSQEAPHGSLLPGILPNKPAILTAADWRVHGTKGWRPTPKHPPADLTAAPVPVLSVVKLAYLLWPEQVSTKIRTAAPAQPRAPPFSA